MTEPVSLLSFMPAYTNRIVVDFYAFLGVLASG